MLGSAFPSHGSYYYVARRSFACRCVGKGIAGLSTNSSDESEKTQARD